MANPSPRPSRQSVIDAAARTSPSRTPLVAAVVAVIAIAAIVGGVIWGSRSANDGKSASTGEVPAGLQLGQGYRSFADVALKAGAPTVDVYTDFQCPHCAEFEAILGPTLEAKAKSGEIALIYHTLIFMQDQIGNDSSVQAAVGAFCAGDASPEAFQRFWDLTFAHQPTSPPYGWTVGQLHDLAALAGLDETQLATWQTCLDQARYRDYVVSLDEQATKDAVHSTPTVKVNGSTVPLAEMSTPDKLTQVIEKATA